MASRTLNPSLFHLRTPLLFTTLGISSGLLLHQTLHTYQSKYAIRLDSSPSATSPKDWSFSQYQNEARNPIVSPSGGLNRSAVRQMSAGSIIGLIAGLGISIFSKPLALLLGLAIVGIQTAESYGIHLVPYKWIQGYAKSVDIRSAVQDNAAFKISFGMMFALSAFAEF